MSAQNLIYTTTTATTTSSNFSSKSTAENPLLNQKLIKNLTNPAGGLWIFEENDHISTHFCHDDKSINYCNEAQFNRTANLTCDMLDSMLLAIETNLIALEADKENPHQSCIYYCISRQLNCNSQTSNILNNNAQDFAQKSDSTNFYNKHLKKYDNSSFLTKPFKKLLNKIIFNIELSISEINISAAYTNAALFISIISTVLTIGMIDIIKDRKEKFKSNQSTANSSA